MFFFIWLKCGGRIRKSPCEKRATQAGAKISSSRTFAKIKKKKEKKETAIH